MTHPDKTTGVPVAFGLCAPVCLIFLTSSILSILGRGRQAPAGIDGADRRTDGRREGRRERWMDGWMGWDGMEWTGLEWNGMHGMHETDVCDCLILNLPTANLEAS